MPRALIAIRHPISRAGLRTILERDLKLPVSEVVGDIQSLERALTGPAAPDLVLTDLLFPDGETLALIQRLRVARPEVTVMILTGLEDRFWVERSLESGARAVLLKRESSERIAEAIETVLRGGVVVSSGFTRAGVDPMQPPSRLLPILPSRLTEREMEVFGLIGRGMAHHEIARQLGLSLRTVAHHLGRIRAKGGFEDLVDLTRYAMLWKSYLPSH